MVDFIKTFRVAFANLLISYPLKSAVEVEKPVKHVGLWALRTRLKNTVLGYPSFLSH